MSDDRFTGIPAEAFEFYEALAADPTKTFWEAHKSAYLNDVRGPLEALGRQLQDEFGAVHLFRPYRDVRFSKDKTPYKDHQGMFAERGDGIGWYVQISATGLMVAGGWYSSSPEQVKRYRAAVSEAGRAHELAKLTAGLAKAGMKIDGSRVATRPRGVSADHPNLEWLRYRTLYMARHWEPAAWMGKPSAAAKIRDQWRSLTPLLDWFADVVGPGETAAGTGSQNGL